MLFPINRRAVFDEVAVFQGASYFRSLGEGQVYGLSARGLANKTADPEGEEFPAFRAFWIEEPSFDSIGALSAPNFSDVAPSKVVPFTVTASPSLAAAGE